MRSWLKETRLKDDATRAQSFNYNIGISEEVAFGGDIQTNELMCRFDGILRTLAFVEQACGRFGNRKPTNRDSSFKRRDQSDWTLYETYDESVHAMRHNPERFRKFKESDMLLHENESVGNSIEFDNAGDFLDIGKVLTGEPQCFGVMCGGRIENRFCSIVVNGNARCDVSDKAICRKASRTLRLIDMLEMNGVRCELGMVFTTHQVHCEIIVKQYNDPLDINDLAVALSPDFFRWVVFRLTEHSRRKGAGYGQPLISTLNEWKDEDADNTILINALRWDISTEAVDNEFDRLERKIREDEFASGKDYCVDF